MHPYISFISHSRCRYPEARRELAQWLSEGKIQRKETIIKGGLPKAEQALADLYKGMNTGKCYLLSNLSTVKQVDFGLFILT